MKTQDLIKTLIAAFCAHPKDCQVTEQETPGSSLLVIEVHPADYAKVIGGRGATFRALETLAALAGMRDRKKTRLILPRPANGGEYGSLPFVPDQNWSRSPWLVDLLQKTMDLTIGPGATVGASNMEDTTILGALIEPQELPIDIEEIDDAVGKIFHAIGKANGRNVFVDVIENPND